MNLNPSGNKITPKCLRAAPWLLLLVLLAGLAAVRGLAANYDIGYEIMNGDWQNYNPVRRLLAGQAPYADFTVYLGAGELYSVSGLLLFFGNSFGRSMFATNFFTWFYFELLVLAACTVVLGLAGGTARAVRAAALGISGWCFLAVSGVNLPFSGWLNTMLGYAAHNGNSARMIRSAALPLAVLLGVWGLARFAQKRRFAPHPGILLPVLAGALVPWSNDMGAALYLSLSLAYGLFLIRVYGKNVKQILLKTLQYIAVSVLALGASVLVVSVGHPIAWLRQTRGVSAYQAWYYGTAPSGKLLGWGSLNLDFSFWICLAFALVFAIGIFRCRANRGAVLAGAGFTLTLGMALWNILYCLLSSASEGPAGGAQALLAAMLPAIALGCVWQGGKRLLANRPKGVAVGKLCGKFALPLCAVFAGAVLCTGMAGQITQRLGGHGEGTNFVPALGGWIGDQADKLATEESVLAGRTVWSTYGSALEAMTGQFQPSGTDYIIHVMGDSQRLAYLQKFQAGGFDMVETPSPKVAPAERWSRNANWWFYRELYRYWQPVGTTFACGGMHLFWERTGVDNNLQQPAAAEITAESDTVVLTVKTADPAFCGVADVELDYTFAPAGGLFSSFLHLTATTENELCAEAGREVNSGDFFLPTDRGVYTVPVTIKDGAGTVTLTALPQGKAQVHLNAATVTATYQDWEYFFE